MNGSIKVISKSFSKFKNMNGDTVSFKESSLDNTDFSYFFMENIFFDSIDLRTSNLDHSYIEQSKFINSNLNELHINDSKLRQVSFGNSDVGNLKIDNSLLRQITFGENSNMSDDLRYQISLISFIEPIENFADYLNRIYKNQITEHFGVIDNPSTKFL